MAIDVMSDTTGLKLVELLNKQNGLLSVIAANNGGTTVTSLKDVANIVRNGLAPQVFNIGDQIVTKWRDVASNQEYDCPFDIVAFPTATLKSGEQLPGMRLQWHYATPFGVQFNNYQAFYKAKEELPAGTYHIEMGETWGENCVKGKIYQFTLTKPVPAGGQLAGFRGAPDQPATNWKVCSYESQTASEILETVNVMEGSEGTKLGILKHGGDGDINCLQRAAYGYGRWGQSALRQWLNSDKGVGEWWTPQNDFDRVPDQLATKAGFLTGFDDEFKALLREVQVKTALNTVTGYKADSGIEPLEVTYDKMFPLALEEMNIKPQLAGEGETCPYWKIASGSEGNLEWYKTYPQLITYAIDNHASPQNVRLRSAHRAVSYLTWSAISSGNVDYYGAAIAYRCAPACDLC